MLMMAMRMRMVMRMMQVSDTNRQSHHVEPSAKVKRGKGDFIQQNYRGANLIDDESCSG